jgi:peptidoglycan/LPS O-acetylase OafA/YrhL
VVVVTSVTGFVLATVGGALAPGPIEEVGIENPLGLAGPAGDVASVLTIVGVLLHWWSLPPAAVCVILRFRSSRGVERQQMRWVAAGAAGAVAGLLLGLPGGLGIAPDLVTHIIYPALLCPPVAIGVAVLRYRLYDLDRIVSRTLGYGLLTVLLGLGYAAVVLGLGRLLPRSSSLVVAAATLAAVAAFSPLHRRVQRLVDRRFNRRRYDAARTVEGFAARLRDQVDLDALHGELLGVVDQTMQPTRASLWLRHAP